MATGPKGAGRGRRRFIAGARCPACGIEERIVTYAQDGTDVMECIECGYRSVGRDAVGTDRAGAAEASRIIAVSADPPKEED